MTPKNPILTHLGKGIFGIFTGKHGQAVTEHGLRIPHLDARAWICLSTLAESLGLELVQTDHLHIPESVIVGEVKILRKVGPFDALFF